MERVQISEAESSCKSEEGGKQGEESAGRRIEKGGWVVKWMISGLE